LADTLTSFLDDGTIDRSQADTHQAIRYTRRSRRYRWALLRKRIVERWRGQVILSAKRPRAEARGRTLDGW
jgi:hypothetical protein